MPFDWSLNPYMGCAHQCAFCYVRSFEQRADRPSDVRYGTSIRVKTNIAQVLRAELQRPGWMREEVVVGAATDPYQPAEGRYRLTRACLVELARVSNLFGIITRGPLVVRDLDVLQDASRRAKVSVTLSVPTLEDEIWRVMEPGAPPPAQRIRAMARLIEGGVRAGIALAPILPGLSDRPERLARVLRASREAGASFVWVGLVHLQPGTREHFLEQLRDHWPEEFERYRKLFPPGRGYLPSAMNQELRATVARIDEQIPRAAPRPLIRPPTPPRQLELSWETG